MCMGPLRWPERAHERAAYQDEARMVHRVWIRHRVDRHDDDNEPVAKRVEIAQPAAPAHHVIHAHITPRHPQDDLVLGFRLG